jgi:hypothetical protein
MCQSKHAARLVPLRTELDLKEIRFLKEIFLFKGIEVKEHFSSVYLQVHLIVLLSA